MYASRTTQFIVGIFAILGIVALSILSLSLGKVAILPAPGYTLYALFDNISGLKTSDQVQLAGVQIGKVVNIGLKGERAKISMRINEGVQIDADSIAAIKTSGKSATSTFRSRLDQAIGSSRTAIRFGRLSRHSCSRMRSDN